MNIILSVNIIYKMTFFCAPSIFVKPRLVKFCVNNTTLSHDSIDKTTVSSKLFNYVFYFHNTLFIPRCYATASVKAL